MTETEFWNHVDKSGECWLWRASKNGNGYGTLYFNGKPGDGAHRVAWLIMNGAIPDGLRVLHRCDVRLCVRPDHLFLGTQKDNQADMARKGRSPSGLRNGNKTHPEKIVREFGRWNCKLSNEDIKRIRLLSPQGWNEKKLLAKQFNISWKYIYRILAGEVRQS